MIKGVSRQLNGLLATSWFNESTGVVKHSLRRCSLPCIDMCDDSDVSDPGYVRSSARREVHTFLLQPITAFPFYLVAYVYSWKCRWSSRCDCTKLHWRNNLTREKTEHLKGSTSKRLKNLGRDQPSRPNEEEQSRNLSSSTLDRSLVPSLFIQRGTYATINLIPHTPSLLILLSYLLLYQLLPGREWPGKEEWTN